MYGATDMLCVCFFIVGVKKVSSSYFFRMFHVDDKETKLYIYLEIAVESFF